MAVKRYVPKPTTFEFDGIQVGLRQPTVDEMIQISVTRAAYIKTLQVALREEIDEPSGLPAEGDSQKLFALQQLIATTLCCDPEDATNPWFAKDAEESKRMGKDQPGDVPAAFFAAAFEAFVALNKSDEPTEAGAKTEDAPLSKTTASTTSDSGASNSQSASDSTSTHSTT